MKHARHRSRSSSPEPRPARRCSPRPPRRARPQSDGPAQGVDRDGADVRGVRGRPPTATPTVSTSSTATRRCRARPTLRAVLRPDGRHARTASSARASIVNQDGGVRRPVERQPGPATSPTASATTSAPHKTTVVNAMAQRRGAVGGGLVGRRLHLRALGGRQLRAPATTRCCSRSSRPRPRSTSRGRSSPARPTSERNVLVNADSLVSSGLGAGQHPGPRARPHPRASATSTPAPRPAPASRTTTGAR